MTVAAYLARIRLNPYSKDVQRDLRYATEMHKTLMRLVPDNVGDTPRQDTGLLYRLDDNEHESVLLVQAAIPLTPHRLPSGYGTVDVKSLAPMFAALRKDLTVRYRITVSPVKRERLPLEQKNQRGKVIPLTGAQADQWWTRRASEAGLHLHSSTATSLRPASSRRNDTHPIKHQLIRYDGTATITDPQALTAAVLDGIGRGKSYGAGLLSLAPVSPRAE
ncbi:type I-E CRISPR-associated protein Cas6/Cse3/CasE [Streptomyces silvisoli]|uniref:Type I-E CRISPR-associated protein Cas6/Cse3/CasE n=1 Tax=Streptomyces silvisoli TaxID=3034235 RepID=A0ABT5ZRB0_9ACTN|nr:type I-E CRISPR-associated protein Cas6/Cse3/CasE [Streptomyces silvisoli]MDF3292364.1 type I-E CRISPR-associated protein Cas6/Cse3/CasE [Streptomyces silvisoli]